MMDPHTESEFLRSIWQELNTSCFASKLIAPSSIGWIDLSSDPELSEEFGYYFPMYNGIALSQRFRYAEDQHTKIQEVCSDPTLSQQEKQAALVIFNSYDIVLRLLAHEMVHQAAHQAGGSHVSHGEEFLKHAAGVAAALEIPCPTLADAHHWPDIRYFLALEIEEGNVLI